MTVTGADGSRVRRQLPADHHADWTTAGSRPPRWSGSTTSGGRSSRRTSRCGTPCSSGRVLRSGDRPGLEQETWALLTLYQLLRMAMVTAVETRPGHRPGPGQLHHRAGSRPRPAHRRRRDLPGRPGRPARRHRPGRPGHPAARPPAPVQRPQGQMRHLPLPQPRRRPPAPPRRHHRDRHHHQHPARGPASPAATRYDRSTPRPPRPPTRRERVTAIITSQPPRDWSGHELAVLLRRQTPQHAHPARRMGTAGLLHPHRLRHLPHSTRRQPIPPRQPPPDP